jgi:hypothetical protein
MLYGANTSVRELRNRRWFRKRMASRKPKEAPHFNRPMSSDLCRRCLRVQSSALGEAVIKTETRLVFLSHSAADTRVAKQIAREIEARGATPFLDEAHADAGADFEEDILNFGSGLL